MSQFRRCSRIRPYIPTFENILYQEGIVPWVMPFSGEIGLKTR